MSCLVKTFRTALLCISSIMITVIISSANDDLPPQAAQDLIRGDEILVARNEAAFDPVWCGDNSVLVTIDADSDIGTGVLQCVDFVNKKALVIRNDMIYKPLDYEKQNGWVIYANKNIDSSIGEIDRQELLNVFRYDKTAGKDQKIAITTNKGKLSPDSRKFLVFGSKDRLSRVQPASDLTLVWSRGNWKSGRGLEVQWLNDSARAVIINDDMVYLETFENNESANVILLESDIGSIKYLKADKTDRLYMLEDPELRDGNRLPSKDKLNRCIIKGLSLECENLLGNDVNVASYDVDATGQTVVFKEKGSNCIWLYRVAFGKKECLAHGKTPVGISPDGKWIVYRKFRRTSFGAREIIGEMDLYAIRIR